MRNATATADRTQPFAMQFAEFPKLVVVRLAGKLGAADVDHLRGQLQHIMRRRPTHVVVDMSALEFLGSLAVGALLELRMDLLRHEGGLVLAAVPPNVVTLLRASRLDELFHIKENVAAALGV